MASSDEESTFSGSESSSESSDTPEETVELSFRKVKKSNPKKREKMSQASVGKLLPSQPGKEVEYVEFSEFVADMQKCIKESAKLLTEDIELDIGVLFVKKKKSFLRKNSKVHLMHMVSPYKERPGRARFSEKDTRYENIDDIEVEITHTCGFDERKLVSVRVSKGHTVKIGGPSVGCAGASASLDTGYQFNWTQEKTNAEDKGNSHNYSVKVLVPPKGVVVVKEVLYKVEKEAKCALRLILPKKYSMRYSVKGKPQKKSVKDILNKKSMPPNGFKWMYEDKDNIYCFFHATCHCDAFEHSVQVIKQKSDTERLQEIAKNS